MRRKAHSIAPTATTETPQLPVWKRFALALPNEEACKRRPKIAFVAAPRNGSSGIHQSGVSDRATWVTWPESSDILVKSGRR